MKKKIGKHIIDFETNDYFYEIKTRRYNMTGTAGEKILYVGFKYRNLTKIKPIKIVLIAYQETEMSELFYPDELGEKYIEFYKSVGVEYIPFTNLISEYMISEMKIKPFIKWVGGKSKILSNITSNFIKSKIYLEPFLGGGSVLLESLKLGYDEYIVNDINTDLINTWITVKDNCEELIKELIKYETLNIEARYYEIREKYNTETLNKIERSAIFIYLNKTCFRGVYRVNKSGKFNVPYGNYKLLNFDYTNIRNVSKSIQNVQFENMNYIEFIDKYKTDKCFIYMDPPYYGTFNSYDKELFDNKIFKNMLLDLDMNYIVSNSFSFTSLFTDDEISCYDIKNIETNEYIDSKNPGKKRKEIMMLYLK